MLHCKWSHFRKWNILKSYDFLDWPTITEKKNQQQQQKKKKEKKQLHLILR